MAVLRIRLRPEALGIRPGYTIVPDSSAILTANEKISFQSLGQSLYGVLMVSELAEALSGQNSAMNSILALTSKKKLVSAVLIHLQPNLIQKSS